MYEFFKSVTQYLKKKPGKVPKRKIKFREPNSKKVLTFKKVLFSSTPAHMLFFQDCDVALVIQSYLIVLVLVFLDVCFNHKNRFWLVEMRYIPSPIE